MALPYDGESEFGRQSEYELTQQQEVVKPLSINPRGSGEVTYEFQPPQAEDDEPPKKSRFLPSCFGSIPKVIVILLALLIILFFIFSIPLIFALTQSPQELSSTINDRDDIWPVGDDDPTNRMGNDTISMLTALLPPNVTLCRGMGFVCANRPDVVVGTNSLCDGIADCPDGSDEVNCKDSNETMIESGGKCQNGTKYCKTSNKCLPKRLLCDGIRDCDDGSDEDECDCKQCSGNGKVLCLSSSDEKGFCLQGDRVCDGIRDCPNGEDEDGCPGEIKLNETQKVKCNDGKSYSKIYACLGLITACKGVCDEKDCGKCSSDDKFKCKKDDKSVLLIQRCDGRPQCPDGSDEENCSIEECSIHPFPMYMCSEGKRCFRKDETCKPHSRCPNPSKVDNGFCAAFGRLSIFL